LAVEIRHTFGSAADLNVTVNNKSFQEVKSKRKNGTALAHKKGKT
jgi:hypothetical protein